MATGINSNEPRVTLSITKKMYGWTKWGGANLGLAQKIDDEWFCQFCGEKQSVDLPCYMISIDSYERDYLRACSKCKHVQVIEKTETHIELLRITKKR